MDALVIRCAVLAVAVASMGASYRTPNFIVQAPSAQMAEQIGRAAEDYRRELAMEWLGTEMRNWAQPCPITASVADHLGAGGATSFVFEHGEVFGWRMTIQGSLERILDSVLPHEVTHTVFATHFRQPLPRWADEGACTTVEHTSEKAKQQRMLIDFLHTNRGIAFSRMFAMREYPSDVMPLYSQGFSLARYLISQGGKKKFLNYIGDGLRDDNWTRATQQHYGYDNLLALQNSWLGWVREGSPAITAPEETLPLVAVNAPGPSTRERPEPNVLRSDAMPVASSQPNDRPLRASASGSSVYDVAAAQTESTQMPDEVVDDTWRPRRVPAGQLADTGNGSRQDDAPRASLDRLPGPAYQVTRPQEIQRPRQVILEWNRSPGSDATATAARQTPGPL